MNAASLAPQKRSVGAGGTKQGASFVRQMLVPANLVQLNLLLLSPQECCSCLVPGSYTTLLTPLT